MSNYDPAAERAANDWLKLIDAGDARGSWRTAASLFKKAVTEEQWSQALSAARSPLGAVVTRTLNRAESLTQLPGAPDGHYVVIQFDTQFERKQAAVETVTPMLDTDGEWRVSGYFVR